MQFKKVFLANKTIKAELHNKHEGNLKKLDIDDLDLEGDLGKLYKELTPGEQDAVLDFIVDDNPLKQNRFTPGTHIPIKASNEIYKKKPDLIIILAWNYASHIIKLHKKFKKTKGKFIIPFPKIKIL